MDDNNINVGSFETNIDCGNRKIKIKKITSNDPTKCSIVKVGNKLTEMCDGKKSCKVINNILECPGFDIGINYGCIDDIGRDLSDGANINITQNSAIGTNISVTGTNTIKTSINESYTNSLINDTIKNSISTRINSMNYNQVSENIKKRYERLSSNQIKDKKQIAKPMAQPITQSMGQPMAQSIVQPIDLSNTEQKQESKEQKQETKEEVVIIQNQEELASTINMSEHEAININESSIGTVLPIKKQNLIMDFWDKYKFWIIVCFIMLLLIFIGVVAYMYREKKPANAIETINVNAETVSSTKMSMNSDMKKTFFPKNKSITTTSSDLPFKSTISKLFTPKSPSSSSFELSALSKSLPSPVQLKPSVSIIPTTVPVTQPIVSNIQPIVPNVQPIVPNVQPIVPNVQPTVPVMQSTMPITGSKFINPQRPVLMNQ